MQVKPNREQTRYEKEGLPLSREWMSTECGRFACQCTCHVLLLVVWQTFALKSLLAKSAPERVVLPGLLLALLLFDLRYVLSSPFLCFLCKTDGS